MTELVSTARQLYEESCELLRDKAHNLVTIFIEINCRIIREYSHFQFVCLQKLREDLENKLSLSLATMEQELRKCVFDEGGSCLVYLQHLPTEDQVK